MPGEIRAFFMASSKCSMARTVVAVYAVRLYICRLRHYSCHPPKICNFLIFGFYSFFNDMRSNTIQTQLETQSKHKRPESMPKYAIKIIRQSHETLHKIVEAKSKKEAILNAVPDAIPESYWKGECGTIGDYRAKAICITEKKPKKNFYSSCVSWPDDIDMLTAIIGNASQISLRTFSKNTNSKEFKDMFYCGKDVDWYVK